jgi:hypothetical protein
MCNYTFTTYYLFTIFELDYSTNLELIINYGATPIIKRFTDCVIESINASL